MTEEERITLYIKALRKYGIDAQRMMVVEETGELLNALAKECRGRATNREVITELADVDIMIEQMAVNFGYADFKEEKERKLKRLSERLEK